MNYWKVYCMEDSYPGLWHTWFTRQVAAVGWAARWGFSLRSTGKAQNRAWTQAKAYLLDMEPGDRLVVQLRSHRVGRIGTITDLKIEDRDWNPTVPGTKDEPDGEQGRLIHVRWDLSFGPLTPNMVVSLPEHARFGKGSESRWTVYPLDANVFGRIEQAMRTEENWVSLQSGFDRERWLSDHLSVSPHELEAGMRPYPSAKVREQVFDDGTRSDVLLLDRDGNPVVVECKQDAPAIDHLRQLRGYMAKMEKLVRDRGEGRTVRGILVHGGPRRVHLDVRRDSERNPAVELVRYVANVDFTRST
jgi:hypothetical protein